MPTTISTTTARERLQRVQLRIKKAALQADRPLQDIGLLAVSKTKPIEDIRALAQEGLVNFGENYLQEALEKQQALADLDLIWHFIGPIQSNKTRDLAANFAWVHTVDRLKIARRLNDQRPDERPPLNICLQVNISGEASKSGMTPQELPAIAAEIAQLPHLRLRGLMAIPTPETDPLKKRKPFAALRELIHALPNASLDTLSMGMSADLEAAIAEGSTIVRIGTALFGPRAPKPKDSKAAPDFYK